jgi:RNA polymerase sigma-70 factor (ECF subfamily)
VGDDLDDLPARIRAGEHEAFAALVRAVAPRLVRVAARLVGDIATAEDVVQEALVKAHAAIVAGSFAGRGRVEAWLYRIVTNGAYDARRRQRRRPLAERVVDAPAPERLDTHLALQELAAWLDELPAAQRVALVLSALEGLSQREIAEIQECSEGAVEQRLVRARAALRAKEDLR